MSLYEYGLLEITAKMHSEMSQDEGWSALYISRTLQHDSILQTNFC